MFGLMMTASAGPDSWVPVISFFAAVVNFGIGSWLFMFWTKPGRVVNILLGLMSVCWASMAIWISFQDWTTSDTWAIPIYVLPVIATAAMVFLHVGQFKAGVSLRFITRCILAVVPFTT